MTHEDASLDDSFNRQQIDCLRSRIRNNLTCTIVLDNVENFLLSYHNGDETMDQAAWNGFFACIAFLRHAYRFVLSHVFLSYSLSRLTRWGVVPIVKEAQGEILIDLPMELQVPWRFLQRFFGVTSESGNLTSNVYNNMNSNRELVYEINQGMSDVHRKTEVWNSLLFVHMEEMVSKILDSQSRCS